LRIEEEVAPIFLDGLGARCTGLHGPV